jgi:cell fate regulator YaaT (PSP1 superfamily)
VVEVVGVRFKRAGKIYYFSSGDLALDVNDKVIVETARGVEFGELVIPPRQVTEEEVVLPLKPVIRRASAEDERLVDENKTREKEAFQVCLKKITDHQLPMKLVDVEYTFDGNKIIFSFTAEGRVDFRELVKDLASVFRTRIELRQIGVRDEAKMLGGVGSCGRILCCSSFLGDFEPVSIRMAKDQKLSLNPTKISGICGRLMCCLKYENSAYDEENREHCRENCRDNCKDQNRDKAGSSENGAASSQRGSDEGETKPERPNLALPVTAGKGRQDGRNRKGEKNKGKSEKV